MLRRVAVILVLLTLVGCGRAAPPPPPAPPTVPVEETSVDETPAAWDSWPGGLTRGELREGLEQQMNAGGESPAERLKRMFKEALRWQEADLNGDGTPEYVVAAPVVDRGRPGVGDRLGAGLFVISKQDGRYHVDVTDRMDDRYEVQLMPPNLHGVADLAGAGTPQILWSRPMEIATGPQPLFLFVTSWRPGSFTALNGEMAISSTPKDRPTVAVEGREIVLTGGTRKSMFFPPRTDRYRYVDGAFRLIDRRFVERDEGAYGRLWDGLVAEDVGRFADAEKAYRDALDPGRPLPSQVPQYHNFPLQLTQDEVAAFGESLRALVRLRLGALLMASGRQQEATELLTQAPGSYKALTDALLQAGDRQPGCDAAAAWAGQDPHFLPALNRGIAELLLTPQLLCSHPEIEDHIP